ncbi:hypothetical protein IFT72_09975 [Frigoribacterium sp. CFBP 8754]|jgi:hypothetical protein|uniref:hypothetical protein n=1 Tax=Frigoribacterium sp. CFBP 8754 TaxID=2775290 RepID=UPI001785C64B|nr:hypothetical protein [Frigoribacterium sp. CFBP 8754]MBD8660514.1 hypothetical protein [Frigoribacterium sp. CFBP 8754]
MSNETAKGKPRRDLTDDEIAKGTVVNRWVRRALAAGLVASLVVAAVVVLRVPLDTTIAYRGNGRDVGLPVLALLLVPLIFVIGLFKSRGPDAGKVPEAERQFIVVGYPIFMVLALGGQLWFAALFFDAAGA